MTNPTIIVGKWHTLRDGSKALVAAYRQEAGTYVYAGWHERGSVMSWTSDGRCFDGMTKYDFDIIAPVPDRVEGWAHIGRNGGFSVRMSKEDAEQGVKLFGGRVAYMREVDPPEDGK